MILYMKNWWSLTTLRRFYGSAFPRGLLLTLVGTLFGWLLSFFLPLDTMRGWFAGHPYPFITFAFGVGSILVFRNNFAYQRFWEGRTQMQMMDSKWVDVVTQALMFDRGSLPEGIDGDGLEKSKVFGETFVHLMSLLHALALQNLRRDWDLDNLSSHDTISSEPNMSVKIRRAMKRKAVRQLMKSMNMAWWRRLALRFKIGMTKFPTDIFHVRSNRTERECYNQMMPLGVIGGVHDHEKLALGGDVPTGVCKDSSYWQCNGKIDKTTGVSLPGAGERIHVVNDWIHALIMERRREGGLNVPAPIVTRMFSVMSQGMEGFENCRKLADTPFPFPYAQLIMGMLIMFSFMLPILLNSFALVDWFLMLLNFITLCTHFALNELARDLEDPFIYDPNDLPLMRYHYAFNERLLAIARTTRPISNTETNIVQLRNVMERVHSKSLDFDEMEGLTGRKLAYFAHDRVGGEPLDIALKEKSMNVASIRNRQKGEGSSSSSHQEMNGSV